MALERPTAADGKPIYRPGSAPRGLATSKQLADRGLKPGGRPVAYLDMGTVDAALFDERNVMPHDADGIRIEMDRATVEALHAALYGFGEHIAAGAPLPDFSPEDNSRLGKVIEDLWWHLRHQR
ncbi:hypothetical protein G7043_08780 [Lentzea sp. NEAU-D13]|uniref:Uncharacterized protein n=1 Tax=Lentzea alba TaxID=2714351 RepID=A0A7C9VWS9_9PSEU|nr:hypothetical protein [Lentzea alba]NGY59020.1 hypothetical protein [Lentzea alba]